MDINHYANDALLDFVDAFHSELVALLKRHYGDSWLAKGVQAHFPATDFNRIQMILSSPMRAVDRSADPEDMFGIEHLINVVEGNWGLLKEKFGGDRERDKARVYIKEIVELRNKLAHRRKHHLVRPAELMRFAQNARRLLEAIGSVKVNHFAGIVESLAQGGKPWGTQLAGRLPHLDEIYDEFIGRPEQLRTLGDWLMSDAKPVVVWGFGGAGKSALAYKFAKEVTESAPNGFDAVVWLTAKRSEFIESSTRERVPDFTDTMSFCKSVWEGLYDDASEVSLEDDPVKRLVDELNKTKCLIVIDDLDTVLDDTETADFLLYELRACKSSILYTSRQQIPNLKTIEVPGFEGDELSEFIRLRSVEYGVNPEDTVGRAAAISSVTGGYPLFVDDLIRHSILVGINTAIQDWGQRRGDAAREYALSRQLDHLQKEGIGGKVLKGVAASDRPLTLTEIGKLVGITDSDAEAGVESLLKWHLLRRSIREEDSDPVFNMNANTRRLTELTFKSDPEFIGMKTAVATLTGERVPEAKRIAIGVAISQAQRTLRNFGIDVAAEELQSRMTGELAHSADLYGVLGWIHSQPGGVAETAREYFEEAYRLGSKNVNMYFHWMEMEKRVAEQSVGQTHERTLLDLWGKAAYVVEIALERCGAIDALFQQAGYLRSRQAQTHERLNEFVPAQGAHRAAVEWFEQSLSAPKQDKERFSRYQAYRGLAISYAALNDLDRLVRAVNRWKTLARNESAFLDEVRRVVRNLPEIERRLPWL